MQPDRWRSAESRRSHLDGPQWHPACFIGEIGQTGASTARCMREVCCVECDVHIVEDDIVLWSGASRVELSVRSSHVELRRWFRVGC